MTNVTVEVRAPRRTEMAGYYRALPFANGLPSWEPANAAWYGGSEPWPPPRVPATADQLEEWAESDAKDPAFHPVATFVDGACVGASATISFTVTVPGGQPMPMAGVTGTGVIATHRRRGYLRQMMQSMFDAALLRGEPLAMLSANEGSIYGRFGFSPATYRARVEIARHDATLLPGPADSGTLHLIDAAQARTVTIAAISSLFFGGVSAHDLAFAGHLSQTRPEIVARLARLFAIDPAPHNSFGF